MLSHSNMVISVVRFFRTTEKILKGGGKMPLPFVQFWITSPYVFENALKLNIQIRAASPGKIPS